MGASLGASTLRFITGAETARAGASSLAFPSSSLDAMSFPKGFALALRCTGAGGGTATGTGTCAICGAAGGARSSSTLALVFSAFSAFSADPASSASSRAAAPGALRTGGSAGGASAVRFAGTRRRCAGRALFGGAFAAAGSARRPAAFSATRSSGGSAAGASAARFAAARRRRAAPTAACAAALSFRSPFFASARRGAPRGLSGLRFGASAAGGAALSRAGRSALRPG